MLKTPESTSVTIWRTAVAEAIGSGKSAVEAIDVADHVMLAYESRFQEANDAKLGATIKLSVAVQYYERSALVGKTVMVMGYKDVPPIAKIKDFSDGSKISHDLVLVEWVTSGPDNETERWIGLETLQLVMSLT